MTGGVHSQGPVGLGAWCRLASSRSFWSPAFTYCLLMSASVFWHIFRSGIPIIRLIIRSLLSAFLE
jgi:hypothetical protein